MNIMQTFSKGGAPAFLYGIGIVFACVLAYQMVIGRTLDNTAIQFLWGVLGFAINNQGVASGVAHTNDTVAKVASVQLPVVQLAAEAAVNAATTTTVETKGTAA